MRPKIFLPTLLAVLAIAGAFGFLIARRPASAATLAEQLKGQILLQVERNGEAWYVYPNSATRFFLGRPKNAFDVMRNKGLGISNANLAKIPRAGTKDVGDANLQRQLSGMILLQVQKNGEAWYVNPKDLHRYDLGRPNNAFNVMRRLGLGISDKNLAQISIDTTSLSDTAADCGNAVGNGNTIVAGPSAPSGGDFDQTFRSLTVDPADPNRIFIGTERNGLLYSGDGGQTWSRYRQGIRHLDPTGYTEMWDLAIAPTDRTKMLLAANDSPGPLIGDYPSNIAGVYLSTNTGQSWTRKNCGLTNAQIASIVFNPTNASVALAGGRGGIPSFSPPAGTTWPYYNSGIYRTTNGGTKWVKQTLPGPGNSAKSDFWRILARGTNPTTYFSFGLNLTTPEYNVGFIKSTDGVTWAAMAADHRTKTITDFDVSADGQVIAGSVRDAQELVLSTDGGATWTSKFYQLNGVIAISPADSSRALYSTSDAVYLTTDRFATDGQLKISVGTKTQDIVFASSDPNIVYAIASGYLLYRSSDAGASFTLVKNLRSDVLNAIP